MRQHCIVPESSILTKLAVAPSKGNSVYMEPDMKQFGGLALASVPQSGSGTPCHTTTPCHATLSPPAATTCSHPSQVLPLLEAVMGPAGPAEVPGAGSVVIGRTQLDRLLRVIPKPSSVSINQLRLAASIAGQDQVGWSCGHMGCSVCVCVFCSGSSTRACHCQRPLLVKQ